MKVSTKDMVGIALVATTLGVLIAHVGPGGHQARHPGPVADAGGAVTTAVPRSVVAFVDVSVLPMGRDDVLHHQVVIVESGFVRRVGPVGVIEPPAGARRVQGDGSQYLMPGLTDAHVHLPDGAEAWLPLFVANGVTTVFNLRGDERHLALRDRIRAGDLVGPTIYTSGPFLNLPEIRSAEDAVAEVQRQARRGYDFIKVHGELSEEAYDALTEASRAEEIAVVGHAPRNLPFSKVLENRQAGVAHAEELIYTSFPSLDTSELASVAVSMARAGTWLTPTLSSFANIASQWGDDGGLADGLNDEAVRYAPKSLRDDWQHDNPYVNRDPADRAQIESMYDFHFPLIRALFDAGVPMLAGTDTPVPVMVPGFSLHTELAALRTAGLSGYEVLAAATRNPGRFVRENVDDAALFGTVQSGARADLILVSGNPLEDLGVLRRPSGVMVRGQWFDRDALDRMLESAAGRR